MEYKGKILLLQRNPDKSQENRWGVPAGKIEQGEEPLLALAREIKEETALIIPPEQLRPFRTVYVRYPDYDFSDSIFSLQLNEQPTIVLKKDEHQKYTWVTPHDALTMNLVREEHACIKLFYAI